jgi:hypothetical protein
MGQIENKVQVNRPLMGVTVRAVSFENVKNLYLSTPVDDITSEKKDV